MLKVTKIVTVDKNGDKHEHICLGALTQQEILDWMEKNDEELAVSSHQELLITDSKYLYNISGR